VTEIRKPAELLKELREATAPDRIFINDFGERVWLTICELNEAVIGTTDCCLVSAPCDYHASLTHQAPGMKQ
jgi:hypothetical protein